MTNGNLAYKNDYVTRNTARTNHTSRPGSSYQYYNRRNTGAEAYKKTVHPQQKQERLHTQPAVKSFVKDKNEMAHRRLTLQRIVYMLIIALAASFMISKYVAVRETAGEIKSLQNQLESTRAYTSQRIFEMERNIDLSEVEEIATTELGMQRPESYQIIYVNVDKDDLSELKASEVEGAGNDIKAFMEKLKANILELFSIN